MKGVKFKIDNNSKFSVRGSDKDLKDIFSSNTLFSALINNISLIYGDHEATRAIEQFEDDNFSISSMFIGLDFYNVNTGEIKNTLYFVPKPEVMIQRIETDEDKLEEYVVKRKKAKNIKMISLNALKNIGNFWTTEEKIFDFDLFELVNIGKDLACTKEEVLSIDIEEFEELSFVDDFLKPHVKVNRMTSESEQFFYQKEKLFRYQYIGEYRIEPFMYFMYSGELSAEIKSAINLMVDEGVGGRRSVGMGSFKSNQYIDIDLLNNMNADVFINVSSYLPLKEELEYLLGYKLGKANGYVYSKGGQPFRKKSIRTIDEGAVVSKKVIGQLVDVTPLEVQIPHKVYYNGKSFCIGVGGGNNE